MKRILNFFLWGALVSGFLVFAFFFWNAKNEKWPTVSPLERREDNSSSNESEIEGRQDFSREESSLPENEESVPPVLNPPLRVMAWVYPGEPACSAAGEFADGRAIDILKSEYFSIDESGALKFLTEADRGCNAYSKENVLKLKRYSTEQFVTISSSYSKSMDIFLRRALHEGSDIDQLVNFVVSNSVSGIELDFEDFGGWDAEMYARYKQFVDRLGASLREKGKKLMIDGPAIASDEEASWFRWRYADFVDLPVDFVVVMVYDYQFDHGSGSPIAPLSWMEQVISRTLREFPDRDRLSIGIPSYGYEGKVGSPGVTLLTIEQIRTKPGFETARRDASSAEMTWERNGRVYFYQDQESLDRKRELARKAGVPSVSVWHLGGGNPWFSLLP